MTRIIAGEARGRRLRVPGHGTRPTADRVRESCFSAVESQMAADGVQWSDLTVLDLYAGSGALGLEALSRGAAHVALVERAREALRVLAANVETVGLAGARVVARDAARLPSCHETGMASAGLVFVDPPYEVPAEVIRETLQTAAAGGWIAQEAMVVVERAARDDECPLPAAWTHVRTRLFGDTALWYGRASLGESD